LRFDGGRFWELGDDHPGHQLGELAALLVMICWARGRRTWRPLPPLVLMKAGSSISMARAWMAWAISIRWRRGLLWVEVEDRPVRAVQGFSIRETRCEGDGPQVDDGEERVEVVDQEVLDLAGEPRAQIGAVRTFSIAFGPARSS